MRAADHLFFSIAHHGEADVADRVHDTTHGYACVDDHALALELREENLDTFGIVVRERQFGGRVSDSGEGRWTVQAAIEVGVPAHVLSAALYSRFDSQGRAEYADKPWP